MIAQPEIGYCVVMPSRSVLSLLVLCPVLLLVIATQEARPPSAEAPVQAPLEAPAAAEAAPEAPVDPLQSVRGRQIWMVNAPEADCLRAESMGMTVTCEPERPGAAGPEIVVWCPEISQSAAESVVAALALQGVVVRTWEEQPADQNPDECGQFYEITLRY